MENEDRDFLISTVFAAVAAAICWAWPSAIPVIIFIIFMKHCFFVFKYDKKTEWIECRIYNLSAETWVLYGRTEPPLDEFPPLYPREDEDIARAIHKENKNRKKWDYVDRDYFLEEIYGRKPKKRDVLDDEENEQEKQQEKE